MNAGMVIAIIFAAIAFVLGVIAIIQIISKKSK